MNNWVMELADEGWVDIKKGNEGGTTIGDLFGIGDVIKSFDDIKGGLFI